MRKKTLNCIFDNILWYALYMLPLICFVVMLWHNGSTGLTLSSVFENCGLSIVTDNIVVNSLIQLFGVGGLMPFFVNNDLIIYFSYFIIVNIIHLAVDVLLFIPRFGHNLMNKGGDIVK